MKSATVVQSRADRRLKSLGNAPVLMVLLVLIVPSNIVGLASALGYAAFAGKDSRRLLPLLVATALFWLHLIRQRYRSAIFIPISLSANL
jgi:hypothetical protein